LQPIQRLWQNLQRGSIYRYFRAFWGALRMTLRGETPPPVRYPGLRSWIDTSLHLVEDVIQAADGNGFTPAKRQEIVFTADGRRISMNTVLTSLKYHVTEEYPYLLRNLTEHSQLAIYSSNLNDEYRLTKLAEHLRETHPESSSQLMQKIEILRIHLNTIPQE
jgi:hypothetical protein